MERVNDRHEDDHSPEPSEWSLVPAPGWIRHRADEWEQLSKHERTLLSAQVVERWTEGLSDDDYTLAEVARLERRRRITLETIRDGAELTDTEMRLWQLLRRHEGRTVTFAEIIRHLWPQETKRATRAQLWSRTGLYGRYIRTISQHLSNVKRKIEVDRKRPQHFMSEPGVGYRWYSFPPARDDGEDYSARAEQGRLDRREIRSHRGELPPGRDADGRYRPGPEHPDYQAIDVTVTSRSSSRRHG